MQVYLEIDGVSASRPVTARVARYMRSDNSGVVYHLADMQGIFARLENTCVIPSARSDNTLLLSVTTGEASIERLDMMLEDPQAEVCRGDLESMTCLCTDAICQSNSFQRM